jgi:Leucine-rich repeat (LRR) protein
MRRQKQIPISSFLHPKTKIINKSISLSANNINLLDELDHYVSSEIECLDLSCNKLTSLKGIEQFTELKELNIADNKIGRC